ncbi:MAG: hypothetical protein P4L82_03155 [Ancalomicrobiaceae bacterium]|nr:hypothetical protein [Ancalomicrobiaceae bacterium]
MISSVSFGRAAKGMSAAAALVLAGLTSGCGDTSIGSSFFHMTPEAPKANDDKQFAAQPTCPNAEIRYGTEAIQLFEPGKQGDLSAVRFQISVQRAARDCDQIGDNIIARVGAAGRVIAGPKGATGKVSVPVRIAAVNGDKVIYSALKVVEVDVAPPDFGADWSVVDEQVTIPAAISNDTIIYVGLDEKGKLDKPTKAAKSKAPKTVKP